MKNVWDLMTQSFTLYQESHFSGAVGLKIFNAMDYSESLAGTVFYFIITSTLLGGYYYYHYFTNGKTEVLKG